MAGSRLEAAGRAADKLPAMATNCITTPCPPSCAEKWRDVEAETAQAVQSPDPLERNRKISAAYASMNIRRPDMQWIGLASIVSRQAGCAMEYADEKAQSWNPLVSDPATVATQALAETNSVIYKDIFPVMRFYEKHGTAALQACQRQRPNGKGVSKELREAAHQLDQGDARGASDLIAENEQNEIVQAQIYNKVAAEYRQTFESNEYWAGNAVGRYFGARRAEIPLSSSCTVGKAIPFTGSISSAGDRIAYYHALMNKFTTNPPLWRYEALTAIVKLGR